MKIKLLLLLLLISSVTRAQKFVDYENPKEYQIGNITISGVKYLNHSALIQLSGIVPGQKIKIPGDEITRAIEKLWKQGLFSDVKISIVKIDGDVIVLDIYLQERPKLAKVFYKGIRKTEEDDLNDKINLVPGTKVTEHVIMKTSNIIKDYFAEKGFYNADVRIVAIDDSLLQNVVNLNINVDKQNKVKINEIIIEGNSHFPEKKIKRYLKETKIKRWYGLFKPSKYIAEKFTEDKKLLIDKYNENGYRDARILADSIYPFSDGLLNIYIKIEEGKQYYFRNITWVGNTKYATTQLNKSLDIKKGDLYDQNRLDKRLSSDQDATGNLYLDDGYLFFRSIPREVQIVNDSVDIEIMIYEGPQANIDRVIINGNTRTNEHVARREVYTLPGELFSKSDIIRSVRELAQLGNFDPEKLMPVPTPNYEEGTVNIEYPVVEKSNDMFELSGGWGANMFVGRLGLRFNNFSTRNLFDKKSWQPLPTGDGQQLSISFQSNGKYYQYYNLSFVEPWLGGKKPNSLTVSLYHNLMGYGTSKMKVYGAAVGLGKRLQWPDNYFSLYNEINYQNYQMTNYTRFEGFDPNGVANNINFKTVFSRNSVDNPIYSRRGSSFTLTMQLTPPYSTLAKKDVSQIADSLRWKWVEYHKWTFKSTTFNPIVGDLVFHTKVEFGIVGFYNKILGYPPFEGFSLGGDGMGYYTFGKDIVGLRGYENETLTPSEGGNVYSKYTMEVRYPLTLSESAQIYALTFVEAGNAWNRLDQFNPFKMYRSAGIGARVFLPMLGMLGIDWGYGFDPLPGQSEVSGGQFHFLLGQQF